MLCLLREAFKFKTSLGMSRFIICAFVMMHMMSGHSRSFSNWAAFIYCLVHLRHYISHHAVWHSSLSTERTLSPRLETYIWSWWNNIGAYPAPFPSPFLFWAELIFSRIPLSSFSYIFLFSIGSHSHSQINFWQRRWKGFMGENLS